MAAQYSYVMKGMTKTFPGANKPVLSNINLQFYPDAKIGIVGPNGTGKSTLMKIMAGMDTEFTGEAWPGEHIRVGYLAQEPELDPNKTVRENVMDGVRPVADLVDRFNEISMIMGDPPEDADFDALMEEMGTLQEKIDAVDGWSLDSQLELAMDALRCPPGDSPVTSLSGGEKRRIALTRLLLEKPDILLLDEPTNHLDLEMRLALTMALQEFSGAVLVVSHDRHLLKSTTDNFLLVADGKVEEFDGDLDDYARWLTDYRLRNAPVSNTPVNPDKTDKKAQRQAAAALRQQLAPHKREADKLEAELGKVHERLAKIEASLGDSAVYEAARKDELRDLLAEQAKLKVREGQLEEAWMEALELLETLQAELEALS